MNRLIIFLLLFLIMPVASASITDTYLFNAQQKTQSFFGHLSDLISELQVGQINGQPQTIYLKTWYNNFDSDESIAYCYAFANNPRQDVFQSACGSRLLRNSALQADFTSYNNDRIEMVKGWFHYGSGDTILLNNVIVIAPSPTPSPTPSPSPTPIPTVTITPTPLTTQQPTPQPTITVTFTYPTPQPTITSTPDPEILNINNYIIFISLFLALMIIIYNRK